MAPPGAGSLGRETRKHAAIQNENTGGIKHYDGEYFWHKNGFSNVRK
jgi:hypothetical protein